MSDENGCYSEPLLNLLEAPPELRANLDVQCAKWFIEQQHIGLVHQRTREGHALLLPSGKLMSIATAQSRKSHKVQQLLPTPRAILFWRLANSQSELDVFSNRHVPKDRVILKDKSGAALLRGQMSNVLFVQEDPPARWLVQACNHSQNRAFTAAACPEQYKQLLISHFKRDIVYDPLVAVTLGNLFEND